MKDTLKNNRGSSGNKLKTLQKLTEANAKTHELPPMSKEERKQREDEINKTIASLKGEELERYLDKIEELIPNNIDFKNQRWEKNHSEIGRVISNYIKEYNRLPLKSEIAEKTGLSRQSVHQHLLQFSLSSNYLEQKEKFKILNHRVLAKVYQFACLGNVKAARLYFEMTGEIGRGGTKNFFIQINNMKVDEDLIRSLPKSTILEIETIIKRATTNNLDKNENTNTIDKAK